MVLVNRGEDDLGEGERDDDLRCSDDPTVRLKAHLADAQKAFDEFVEGHTSTLDRLTALCRDELLSKGHPDIHLMSLLGRLPEAFSTEAIDRLPEQLNILCERLGFRFGLMTPREHEAVGSSGFAAYGDIDPDIPVPLLKTQLRERGEHPELTKEGTFYTFEECDHARRLAGMTCLDPTTGRVTDEVDELASNDPFHFVDASTRAEIVLALDAIRNEINELVAEVQQWLEDLRGRFSEVNLYAQGWISRENLHAQLNGTPLADLLNPMLREIRRASFEAGVRDPLLTPQEIMLRPGAQLPSDHDYSADPYTPLALQTGALTLEEVRRARAEERDMLVNNKLVGFEYPLRFQLEPLNEAGQTTENPRILKPYSDSMEPYDIRELLEEGANPAFPFPRPHKEQ